MRTVTETYNVYKFEELSEVAKEKAREWFRAALDFELESECAIDDVKTVAKMLGIDIKKVHFSGFSNQGDGACFIGTYSFVYDAIKNVREYAPLDEALYSIACQLDAIQSRHNNSITASTFSNMSRYSHENSVGIEVSECNDYDTGQLQETLRDFMRWIYKRLNVAYDYMNSNEAVDEAIIANEYEFTEAGKIA